MNSKISKLIDDLRFVIGFYFFSIGLILMTDGLISQRLVEGMNLNLLTGIVFLVFATPALWFSLNSNK